MVYLYWLGAFIFISPLILGLPLLSRNRVYRTATLLAGMNAGIVTLFLFIYALRWGIGLTYLDELHTYFTRSLPVYYIASLIIGSTILARYYLTASTRMGAAFAIFGVMIGFYLTSAVIGVLASILSLTLREGSPSFETLLNAISSLSVGLSRPNLFTVSVLFLSAFIALYGTASAMRISDEGLSSKHEETE